MKTTPKNEIIKTTVAAIAAAAMVGGTVGVYYATTPSVPDVYAKVDQVFYEQFESSSQITSMTLVAMNEQGQVQNFQLQKKDGLWVIPTHSNYPAEAGVRLSNTATSLLGLVRMKLASSEAGAQGRLGVLDPTAEDAVDNPEQAGKLIRFRDANDESIFELIVGNPVDQDENLSVYDFAPDEDSQNLYYVRVPGEKETYITELDLDISTRFSDWINQDLLEANSQQFRRLLLDNYRLETQQVVANFGVTLRRQFVPEEELLLTRTSSTEPWQLEDLGPEEQVDSEKVNQVIQTIDSLELLDVRPQFQYNGESLLTDDLTIKLPESLQQDQQNAAAAIEQMQDELLDAGFAIAQDPETGGVRMVAENGELEVGTDEGIIYTLLYGAETSVSGQDFQIGDQNQEDGQDSEASNGEADPDQDASENSGRLVLIRVAFDPERVEGKPVPPTEPVKTELPSDFGNPPTTPAGDDAPPQPTAEPISPSSASQGNSESSPESTGRDSEPPGDGGGLFAVQDPAETTQEETASDPAAPEAESQLSVREQAQQQLDQQYQQQLAQYEQQKAAYDTAVKVYQERVEELREKAERLKQRFADWYYVVPNSDLAVLRMSRADIVTEKTEGEQGPTPPLPNGLPPGFDPSMFRQQ